jgi:hypothetical protein
MRAAPVATVRLPTRFPVGTRFVIEGREGRIYQRYLEFPDGRHIDLPTQQGSRARSRRQRTRSNPGQK